MGLKVVVLAAGKGKRMASTLPKVLHLIGGKPMLQHVVETAFSLDPDDVIVIYGSGGHQVKSRCSSLNVRWVEQEEQLGTGHAVMQALPFCHDEDQVLVLYGDVPLISTRLLRQLQQDTLPNGVGLVVADLENPAGFGRIVRNEVGNIVSIVEHKDASGWQLDISEINTGIISVEADFLRKVLPQLKKTNVQNEYYLTDIISLAVSQGVPISGVLAHDNNEVSGVNDRWQQVCLERYYQQRKAKNLTLMGVHLADNERIDIRGDLLVGADSFIDINCIFEGNVTVGSGCFIGANVILKNTTIGDGVTIHPNSVIEGAIIQSSVTVGPFARIRPDTVIESNARVGNFVEIKKTTLGYGSRVNHLTYLGDAQIGRNVNIGAGTITCNYDGHNKFKTTIGDSVFVGSNSSLVAPLTLAPGATVGAGSTITRDVPRDTLVVSRAEQKNVEGWTRPSSKEKADLVK
jgi:bifunctional UDP-N-acetylglucosamine pyrophosphorylase / glucosamine-1-phosphate N-acetyltransferase